MVASSKAAFGVHFDPVGERLSLVDDRGAVIDDERALLVVLDLMAAETRKGTVALPVTLTRVAERVAAFHGLDIRWIGLTPAARARGLFRPEYVDRLLADPNTPRTTLGANQLWQLALLEMWLQKVEDLAR